MIFLWLFSNKIIHRRGVEIRQIGYLQRTRNHSWTQSELDLIVRIDEVMSMLQDSEMLVAQNLLETPDTDTRSLDIHQAVDSAFRLVPQAKQAFIQRAWQQVHPRQMRQHTTVTNLLMTAKRITPNGKTEEDHGAVIHKAF